jgi:hydrogenase expression/formation protein HypD
MTLEAIKRDLKEYAGPPLVLMEVCGTHTASIAKNGIQSLLSDKIRLVSGPGCPVCVTVSEYVDRLCELSMQEGVEVVTFGDMMRVPGSGISLADSRAAGGHVRMVYSPFDCLEMAAKNPDATYVFAAVGFETTAPIYALMAGQAEEQGISNLRFLMSVKTMPAAIQWICTQNRRINGLIAPGHVSVITGSEIYRPLAEKYSLPFVVSGFDGEDVLAAIYALVRLQGKGKVVNLYPAAVGKAGNDKAAALFEKYFDTGRAFWRGMGGIDGSGLYFKKEYAHFDAGSRMLGKDQKIPGCRCGDVLVGNLLPEECPLFKSVCRPQTPKGACMVSGEGACHVRYQFERTESI